MKKPHILNQTTQNSKLKTQNFITPEEDFWSRRANAQTEMFEFAPFGIPAKITANQPDVLAAAHLSSGRFSRGAAITAGQEISLQIVVQSKSTRAVPVDLPEHVTEHAVLRL